MNYKANILCGNTHHFEIARCDNQVVNNIVDLCDQGQDGGLCAQRDRKRRVSVSDQVRDFHLASVCVDIPALQVWGSGPGFSSEDTRWKPSRRVQASLGGRPSHTGKSHTHTKHDHKKTWYIYEFLVSLLTNITLSSSACETCPDVLNVRSSVKFFFYLPHKNQKGCVGQMDGT